jgi:peptidoglycan/LPS O-acetylase OafA/YrhL
MIRFSIYPGAEGSLFYKLETVFLYSPAFAMLMIANFQVYHLFLRPLFEQERRWLLRMAIPLLLVFMGANAWNEFFNQSDLKGFQIISFTWGIITNIGTLIIAVRKATVLGKEDRNAYKAHLLLGSVSLCYIVLSVVNVIFDLYSPIGYWTFFILLWLGSIIMILTYLYY